MTDRFEEALNFINFKMSQEYIETEEYYHIFKYHVRDIIDALTLATEAEQLRKRLAELETAIEQSNKKIQWYERTEATND